MLLSSINGDVVYGLFDNLWDKAYYWRYITIISIFLMVIYKRKLASFEKQFKQSENDKKIIRKAVFVFSELNLKELTENLINNNGYSETQLKNLKEFEKYLNETGHNLLSENLKKAVENLKLPLNNALNFLEKYFIKNEEKGFLILNMNLKKDSVDEFEFQDKILKEIIAFESKYMSFMQEIKDEFIYKNY